VVLSRQEVQRLFAVVGNLKHRALVTVHEIRDWSFAVLDNFIVFRRDGKGTI